MYLNRIFFFSGKEYALMWRFGHRSAVLRAWVYGLHLKEDQPITRCRITISGNESMRYVGPVVSIETQPLDVKKAGLGLKVDASFIKRSLANDELCVTAKILGH
jgi:hypothetical protein